MLSFAPPMKRLADEISKRGLKTTGISVSKQNSAYFRPRSSLARKSHRADPIFEER